MNNIDLWFADSRNEDVEHCRSFLNEAELKRAQQFKNNCWQRRFVIVRAILKQILARYLQINENQLLINFGRYGKPFLSAQNAPDNLVFNVSHSADKIAIVIAKAQQLGVDIEQHKTTTSLSALVKKCFAKSELQYWQSLPEAKQRAVFFDIWTRKEAFAKAVGRGIALGLDQCVTSAMNLEQWLSIPTDYGQARDWKIINLTVVDGFSGAIVTDNLQAQLNIYPWETQTKTE